MIVKNNDVLQKDIKDALHWHPQLNMADIDVVAKEGVITLTGVVDSYGQKEEALLIARNVHGVKAVVENIRVKINTWSDPSDEIISKQIGNILKWQWNIPEDKIQYRVDNGWVTLEGRVQEQYQKEAAYKAVSLLKGVKGITNRILYSTQGGLKIDKSGVESALGRSSYTAKEKINVEVAGNRIILTGSVSSWHQKEEAEKIACNAPGVQQVDNQLVIEYAPDNLYTNLS